MGSNTQHVLSNGVWSVALREQLADAALAELPPQASEDFKLAVMEALVQKLEALREFDRWDPRQLESVVLKRNYQEVEQIDVGSGVHCLHVLLDGRIVSGSKDRTLRIWTKGTDGVWGSEVLEGHTDTVWWLQTLPDGRIVSGSSDNTIRIWMKGTDGAWSSEELKGHTDWVRCLQALPDGRIVSGSDDRTLRIWTKGTGGAWSSEELKGHTNVVCCLQTLPDGRIVSGSRDGTIRIWDGEEIAGGAS